MHSYKDPNKRRELIMKHYSQPQNKMAIDRNLPNLTSHYSTKCVDEIHLVLKIEEGKIIDAKFDGQGCAVHMASADIMLNIIKNKTIEQASEILKNYLNMISQSGDYDYELLGELAIFENVASHLNRLHCAIMIHDALKKELNK